MNYTGILEGLLFVVGDEGLTTDKIVEILEISKEDLMTILCDLQKEYSNNNRGIKIEALGNKLKLVTKKEHKDYYKKLVENIETNLSQSSLETLAIVAYNEPVTRIRIDEIRGVSSSHTIRKLVLRDLIKEIGRSDLPGRPILYGITSNFLDYFGLSSIEQLPKLEEIAVIDDIETDLFESKYREV